MANIIGIMGESGAGKTTSMRNLDPKTTYYIDCDKKKVQVTISMFGRETSVELELNQAERMD